MRKKKQLIWACIFLLVAVVLVALYAKRERVTSLVYTSEKNRIENSLNSRERIANEAVCKIIADRAFLKKIELTAPIHEELLNVAKKEIYLLIFKDGQLVAYNTNSPSPDEFNPYATYKYEPLQLTGGIYICDSKDTLGFHFISAIKVFEWYTIQNQYLQSKPVPQSVAFNSVTIEKTSPYPVRYNGVRLYSLVKNPALKTQLGWLIFIALLAVTIAGNILLRAFDWGRFWWLKLLATPMVAATIINGVILAFPEIANSLPRWLFNSSHSAIGQLLQIAFITAFSIPIVISAIRARRIAHWNHTKKGILLPGIFLTLAALTAGVVQLLVVYIMGCIGSFGSTKQGELTLYLFGVLMVILLGWGMLLLIKSAYRLIVHARTQVIALIGFALLAAGVTFLLPYSSSFNRIIGTTGALFLPLLLAVGARRKEISKRLPSLISILISVVLSLQLISNNQTNNENYLDSIAEKLAVDHDPILESTFISLLPTLDADSTIESLLKEIPKSLPKLNQYVGERYFKSYLAKYDFQITACHKGSKLIVNEKKVDCQNFFVKMATLLGRPIAPDRFYFLNSNNGRISYLFMGEYSNGEGGNNFLAIEIDSKALLNLPGYPSLLSNKAQALSTDLPTNVSYAKYNGTALETKVGSYPYPLKKPEYFNNQGVKDFNNFNHIICYSDNKHIVVVSKEKPSWLFRLSPLVYIFLGAYILATLVLRRRSKSQRNIFTLQKRIRRLSVMLMVISMLAVGVISVGYGLSRQNATIGKNITEKMRSAVTLNEPIVQQLVTKKWSPGIIDSNLIVTSNILYADLNIYTPNGDLMGTSRQEVFSNRLQGFWINPEAYTAIVKEKSDFYLATEKIGSLTYTSAYAPLLDRNGDIIAIINLPYFIRENEIREETMTLVASIANTYLLLAIIAGLLGYYAAYKISEPLQVLKKAMRKTSIDGQPKLLEYRDNDEVGHLVREYNRMATELSKSAQLLAHSEKEKVWREMARQIAHEIKNPLTPIKLSLQQLVRIKQTGSPDWDQRFSDFSKMLLEQVDILARTASQFSSIAKEATANSEVLNMAEIVERTLSLFAGQKVTYKATLGSVGNEPLVFADKELMQKAITNLVSNAIQASADNKTQEVTISLIQEQEFIQLSVSDNGVGIPAELQPRIFEPYFTTKSGGTGLGLVLARKTVEEAGGKIWFENTQNAGTTFYIRLPKIKSNSLG